MSIGVGGTVPAVLVVEGRCAHAHLPVREPDRGPLRAAVGVIGGGGDGHTGGISPDAALVDVGLPGRSGLDLVTSIRDGGAIAEWDPGMPILLVSGQGSPHAAVRAIERGADDFVQKPFHYPELLARLGAVLRRARGAIVHETLRVGALSIDRHARRASLGGRVLVLSAKEFALLTALARDPTRVHTKEELLRDVWGYRGVARTRTVDSHASRLRRKLAAHGGGERWIANVWGVGYRLLAEEA